MLCDVHPPPQSEKGDYEQAHATLTYYTYPDYLLTHACGNHVSNGLNDLTLHHERTEWQTSPQHYLIIYDCPNGMREARSMCQ